MQYNNPSGASDIQRKRLTYLIDKGIISGSAEGICLLTYDQAQDLIDSFKDKKIFLRGSEDRIAPSSQDSSNISPKCMNRERFNHNMSLRTYVQASADASQKNKLVFG